MSVATGVSLAGPAAGSVSAASTAFTVSLTPAGGTSAGDTITPSSTLPGTFTPASVLLTTAAPSLTFTFTPTVQGTHSISIADSGGLTLGGPVSYLAGPPAAAMVPLAGNGVAPSRFSALSLVPGTWVPVLVTIAGCPAPIVAASLIVKASNAATAAVLTKAGLVVDPGAVATDGSYTARVLFNLLEADTVSALVPGQVYSFAVQATTAPAHTVEVLEQGVLTAVSGGSTVG